LDNLTHTVFGLLVAEAALAVRQRSRQPVPPSLRSALLWSSGFANNFPDLDFVYTSISGEKIGYLLHHRGHTHTLVAAVPIGLLVLGLTLAWARFRRVELAKPDRLALFAVSLLGPFFHIALDATNIYGVHPFWPFDSRWFFGDSVFIIEPLLLIVALPALFYCSRRLVSRVLLLAPLVGLLGFGFLIDIVPAFIAVGLVVLGAASLIGFARVPHARRALVGLIAWGLLTLGFFAVSQRVKARAETAASGLLPGSRVLDVAITPMPGNPFCFEAWSVLRSGADYVVVASFLAPLGTDVARCPRRMTSTATLADIDAPAPAGTRWVGSFRIPVAELEAARARDCRVSALLRFFRVPYLEEVTGGSRVLGDLRFDREPDLGFGEVLLSNDPPECPRFLPGWVPPRSDLFAH
jgi:inner membrane protein